MMTTAALVFAMVGGSPLTEGQASSALPPPVHAGQLPVNGGEIYYEEFGAGYPVVFIHDGLVHREVWDAQVPVFAAHYRVIRYDRRGYGLSAASAVPYSNEEDLGVLLDSLRVDHCVLIGSSAGGGLVVDFALAQPQRVDGLVLVGAVVNGLGYSAHFIERAIRNLRQPPAEWAATWANDPYAVAPGNDAARRRVLELLTKFPGNLDRAAGALQRDPERPALPRLSEIRVPTLIVTAEKDIPDVFMHAGALEAGIPGAQVKVLYNAGHLCYLEQPAAFNEAVLEFLSLLSLPQSPAELAQRASPPWTTLRSGFAPVDGSVLYYEVMGAGKPLVLVHGGLLDHRMWDDQFAALAHEFRVIRYDVRAHGLSPCVYGPRRDYEDLRALLDHLGIERAHVAGLSMGGGIAIDFALEHPERVLSLIPVSSGLSGYPFDSEQMQENGRRIRDAIYRLDLDAAAEAFQRFWTDGPRRKPEEVNPAVRQKVRRMTLGGLQPGKDNFQVVYPEPAALDRLAEIQAPTLVCLGELDMPEIHDITERIMKNVRGARRVTFPHAAHMLNMEDPARFNRELTTFLKTVPAP